LKAPDTPVLQKQCRVPGADERHLTKLTPEHTYVPLVPLRGDLLQFIYFCKTNRRRRLKFRI
jgi:hypothetical protein